MKLVLIMCALLFSVVALADRVIMSPEQRAYWSAMEALGYRFQSPVNRKSDTQAGFCGGHCEDGFSFQKTAVILPDERNEPGTTYSEQTPEIKKIADAVGIVECESKLNPNKISGSSGSLVGSSKNISASLHPFFETDEHGVKHRRDVCSFIVFDHTSDPENPKGIAYPIDPATIPWTPPNRFHNDYVNVKTTLPVQGVRPIKKGDYKLALGDGIFLMAFHGDIDNGYSIRILKGKVEEIRGAARGIYGDNGSLAGHDIDMWSGSSGGLIYDPKLKSSVGVNVGDVSTDETQKLWTEEDHSAGIVNNIFHYHD